MSASGTLFLQTFGFLLETRIFKVCQEIRDLLAHGWRRRLPAPGPSKLSFAKVAETWPSTKTLVTGGHSSCTQVRSCIAGDSNNPTRRAVRKTQTHAKTCQQKHKTPNNRDKVVVAAHAEDRTVIETIIQAVKIQMAVNQVAANQVVANNTPETKPPKPNAAQCQLPS